MLTPETHREARKEQQSQDTRPGRHRHSAYTDLDTPSESECVKRGDKAHDDEGKEGGGFHNAPTSELDLPHDPYLYRSRLAPLISWLPKDTARRNPRTALRPAKPRSKSRSALEPSPALDHSELPLIMRVGRLLGKSCGLALLLVGVVPAAEAHATGGGRRQARCRGAISPRAPIPHAEGGRREKGHAGWAVPQDVSGRREGTAATQSAVWLWPGEARSSHDQVRCQPQRQVADPLHARAIDQRDIVGRLVVIRVPPGVQRNGRPLLVDEAAIVGAQAAPTPGVAEYRQAGVSRE